MTAKTFRFNFLLLVRSTILVLAFSAISSTYGQKIEYIPKISSAIVVDGLRENAWDSSVTIPIIEPFGGSFTDENDFSGSWAALWDDVNIYFLFEINDNQLHNLGSGADKFWIHDCAEIFFDLLNDKDDIDTDEVPDDDNYQYRFIWDLDDEPIVENPPVTGMENQSYTVTDADDTTGYNIEIMLPWATLIQSHNFGAVIPGKKLGIEMKINDLDSPTVPSGVYGADAELLWNNPNGTGENLKLSSSFGTIHLVNYLRGDTDPPMAIDDLAGIVKGSTIISLSWASPEDENTGCVSDYDIRYSTDSLELVAWDASVQVNSDSIPKLPGEDQTFLVQDLPGATELYFAVKSKDIFDNTSEISNIIKLKTLDADAIKPAAITDLSADSVSSYAVRIVWTATGNDSIFGTALGYDIRYSETNLLEKNWNDAMQVEPVPDPLEAGTLQKLLIHGLSPEKTYYIGIKAYDQEPNYSNLSNILQVNTPAYILPKNQAFDQIIGTNSFIDVPHDKAEAVSFIREYHDWSWTEIEDDVYEYNRWNGYWEFDEYYTTLQEMGITVCPALWQSPGWLESNPLNKPLGDSEDPVDPASYSEMSQFMYQYGARYGDTPVDESKILLNDGQVMRTGMGVLKYFEDWNEQDRDWAGRDAQFLAEEYAAMASTNIDGHAGTLGDGYGLKTADPTAKFVMGGLYILGTDYVSDMRDWFIANRPDGKWPIDVINMHHYAYTYDVNGISPEDGDYKSKVQEVIQWRNEYAPDNEVWITEFGYDTNEESPNRINPFGGFDQQEIQAQWIARTYLILSSIGVDRVAQFMIRDVEDPTEMRWADCGFTLSSGEGYTPKTSWYYTFTMKDIMKDMFFDAVVSETNAAWVYRFVDESGDKIIYALWSPTSNGSESEYRLKIPEEPTYLYQIKMVEESTTGQKTNLAYTGAQITINISEQPVFVVADYGEPSSTTENINSSNNSCYIYPNPCDDQVNITMPNQTNRSEIWLKIFSIDGKLMRTSFYEDESRTTLQIDIAEYRPGVYFIQLSDGESYFTGRFIKN